MSRRDDAMEVAARLGRWSFSVDVPVGAVFAGSGLLYSGPLDTELCTPWTVSLNAMRYHGGPLPGSLTDPARMLDNQITNLDAAYQARVAWGVDGAMESVTVDYPFGGCTFGVLGSNVRVDVFTVNQVSAGATTPRLSGFLSPCPNVITTVTAPQFTSGVQVLAVLGGAVYAVPPRASAYRVFTALSLIPAATSLRLNEAKSDGTIVKRDGTAPTLTEDTQSNEAGYHVLHPFAQYVTIDNLSATQLAVVGVIFQLDMG